MQCFIFKLLQALVNCSYNNSLLLLVTLLQVRCALSKAEKELEYQSWKAPAVLKQWLQMTFDKETKHFQHKRSLALKQMKEAKEAVSF